MVYSKDVMDTLSATFDSLQGQRLPVSEVGFVIYRNLAAVPEFNAAAPSDSSIQATARHYFCSCGGALTAEEYIEHYFEKGHDHGEPELLIRAAAAEIAER